MAFDIGYALYQLHDRMTWHKVASFRSWKPQMSYDVVWRPFRRFSSTLAIGAISTTLRTPANALITDMYSLSKKGKKGKNHQILPNSCQVSYLFFWGPSESSNLRTAQWPEIIEISSSTLDVVSCNGMVPDPSVKFSLNPLGDSVEVKCCPFPDHAEK